MLNEHLTSTAWRLTPIKTTAHRGCRSSWPVSAFPRAFENVAEVEPSIYRLHAWTSISGGASQSPTRRVPVDRGGKICSTRRERGRMSGAQLQHPASPLGPRTTAAGRESWVYHAGQCDSPFLSGPEFLGVRRRRSSSLRTWAVEDGAPAFERLSGAFTCSDHGISNGGVGWRSRGQGCRYCRRRWMLLVLVMSDIGKRSVSSPSLDADVEPVDGFAARCQAGGDQGGARSFHSSPFRTGKSLALRLGPSRRKRVCRPKA